MPSGHPGCRSGHPGHQSGVCKHKKENNIFRFEYDKLGKLIRFESENERETSGPHPLLISRCAQ